MLDSPSKPTLMLAVDCQFCSQATLFERRIGANPPETGAA
jgi:hypothetical protein